MHTISTAIEAWEHALWDPYADPEEHTRALILMQAWGREYPADALDFWTTLLLQLSLHLPEDDDLRRATWVDGTVLLDGEIWGTRAHTHITDIGRDVATVCWWAVHGDEGCIRDAVQRFAGPSQAELAARVLHARARATVPTTIAREVLDAVLGAA